MTDLLHVLPLFRTEGYVRIIPNLERHGVSVTDLLTLDVSEVARRASVPVREVESLRRDVLQGLHGSLGIFQDEGGAQAGDDVVVDRGRLQIDGAQLLDKWETISTLDDAIDAALGGGIPRGYVTEITGER
jgi:DNA repair protein RAD57